jgi:acyl-CoA synthetase (AMP-forming)/AMP-acid ligase II
MGGLLSSTRAAPEHTLLKSASTGEQYSCSELRALSVLLHDTLPARQLVLACLEPSIHVLATYLALQDAGHVVMVAKPQQPLADLVAAFRPDYVLREQDTRWPGAEGCGSPDSSVVSDHRVLLSPTNAAGVPVHEDLGLLLHTSGSTAKPKAVRLSHGNVLHNAQAIATALGLTPDDIGALTLSLGHAFGLSVLHSQVVAGACTLLLDGTPAGRAYWNHAEELGVTAAFLAPPTCEALALATWRPPVSLRILAQAAGAVSSAAVLALQQRLSAAGGALRPMYGQTEATARISIRVWDDDCPRSVGVPLDDGHLDLDPALASPSEIVYRGPNVMMGYAWGSADLALPNLQGGILRTGDLGEWHENHLHVLGRQDRAAKLLGHRVDVAGLEGELSMCRRQQVSLEVSAFSVTLRVADPHGAEWHEVVRELAQRLQVPARAIRVAALGDAGET